MTVVQALCVCVVTGSKPADDSVPCYVCVVTGAKPADEDVPCCVCVL